MLRFKGLIVFATLALKMRNTKNKKIEDDRIIHDKNIFYCSKFEVNQINTRRVILPQKSWPNMDQ